MKIIILITLQNRFHFLVLNLKEYFSLYQMFIRYKYIFKMKYHNF